MGRIVAIWAWLLSAGLAAAQPLPAPTVGWHIVADYPHALSAFTEGLLVHDDALVESTGLYGESTLSIRDLASGRIRRSVALPPAEFGEGLAEVGDRYYQLTWREQRCHVYDLSLRRVAEFAYTGEGWGLTDDGSALIRSDGSDVLHFHDPADFHELRQLAVRDGLQPVSLLNELEWVHGRIFANVWMTDRIAVIDPASGQVLAWLDLEALKGRFDTPRDWKPVEDVLNGIAYRPKTGHLLVTGKRWPRLFEIDVDPLPGMQ